tara:strand:+ start:866 stop:1009 length:144 start_codon:yes stop_codon:yes gene_type:complete
MKVYKLKLTTTAITATAITTTICSTAITRISIKVFHNNLLANFVNNY